MTTRRVIDSMTLDHGKRGSGIKRIPVPAHGGGVRWVECGWCRQSVTGERAPSGCALCSDHAAIWRETL